MIICAGNMESFDFATSIGIGMIQSAINLTRILCKNRIEEIIFIGSCGLYKDGKILEIYETTKAKNLEISSLLDLSYSPLEFLNVSRETNLTNSSNFITTDKSLAYKFSDLGFFMENMEIYSVLEVAKTFNIPAKGILCATNFCDTNAHDDFLKNYRKSKENLEKYLKKIEII